MATQAKSKGAFIDNLGKVYLLYTGGFFVFVVLLGILEQLGVPNKFIGYGFVFLTILVYAVIGVLSRTADSGEYYVAGRQVPALYNGMATGADWMSAASFIGMAGSLYFQGYDGLAWVLGWTGGYVLVAILIAPFLRKFGAFTVPDFFAARYEGNLPRFLAVVVLIACSFTYVVAQIFGTGLIAQRFLDMDFELAVYVGLAGILLCSMLGGMKAVTWTQVAQYIVLIVAYLIPVIIMSTKKYGLPVPQLTYGQALADIAALEQSMIRDGLAPATMKIHTAPFTTVAPVNFTSGNFFALILCLMVGTASLPHVLMRYFTTPSVREARKSVAWSLFFIFLLYFTAPAYAAFAKLEVYSLIAKKTAITDLPNWIYVWGKVGLVTVCGKAAAVKAEIIAACQALPNHPGVLRFQDLGLNTDAIVISTPEIAGLPYVISGLVAAGGLAAALSTADGLLLAIANALSHDLYHKTIRPMSVVPRTIISLLALVAMLVGLYWLFASGAPVLGVSRLVWLGAVLVLVGGVSMWLWSQSDDTAKRLLISRVLLLAVAAFAAATAATRPADILAMVAWAFSLAAAGIFPALVLGVWWKRANKAGCVVGMTVGFLLCLFYLVVSRYFPGYGVAYFGMAPLVDPIKFQSIVAVPGCPVTATKTAMQCFNEFMAAPAQAGKPYAFDWFVPVNHPLASKVGWMNINNISSALFSLPIGFLTIIVVSLMTKEPSKEIRDMVDATRRPRGEQIFQDKDSAAVAH
ncbi:MAG: sodium:solute symporter family protein [Hyphomicrobiaceae bacterium]